MKKYLSLLLLLPSLAYAKPTYEVKFVCQQIPNNIHVQTFRADNETQAIMLTKDYYNNSTGYKNKGCQVTAVRKIFD